MSRLANLSSIDFEELCRDLAQAETGKRFSAFGPGPDGGADGRHSRNDESTILQCKHYWRSSFSDLKSALRRETSKVEKLKPKRYLFFTSHSLTPKKSDQLHEILGQYLKQPEDVWGREDIEGAIRRHPEIEKSHIKLWLSSTAVLERILNAGIEAFNNATKEELLDQLRVYVHNPSYDDATRLLEEQRILIISGPPGVGKTTLAKMIVYHYLKEGWRFHAINSLEDGFSKIDDTQKTVFYFDDFLGRIELDRQGLLERDSTLATFVKRVRKSKKARFILTTRAHIFEEARLLSDYIDDRRMQLSKYILDMGAYNRKIKSHILFNHLSVSDLTPAHFAALLEDQWLKRIIDHKNYNPRVVAYVSSDCLDKVEASEYPAYVYRNLEDPDLIWDKPFRALAMRCQNLLMCLYFGSPYGEEIEELRASFGDLHRSVSGFHSQPTQPGDFEDALRTLESGFVTISDGTVNLVNPSLRDFLKAYLIDVKFLELLAAGAKRADWTSHLWSHVKDVFKAHPETLSMFANLFREFATTIDDTPSMRRSKEGGKTFYSSDDLALSDRVELLLEWWERTNEDLFLRKAVDMLQTSSVALVSWRDGQKLPGLHWQVNHLMKDDHLLKADLLAGIETRLIVVLEDGLATEDLLPVVESIYAHMEHMMSTEVQETLDPMIDYELAETHGAIDELNSAQDLSEHLEHVQALGAITGRDTEGVKTLITGRLADMEDEPWTDEAPTRVARSLTTGEDFDDSALYSLFSTLIERERIPAPN